MPDTSFTTIRRHLYRQSLAIFGCIVLVLVLTGALVMGAQHVLEQERANLTADFSAGVAYIREQEQFLRQLQAQNAQVVTLLRAKHGPGRQADSGQASLNSQLDTAMPFTLVEERTPRDSARWHAYQAFGDYLADYYSTFWAFSHFPSASLLVLSEEDRIRFSVPAIDAPNASEAMSQALMQEVVEVALRELPDLRNGPRGVGGGDAAAAEVRWLAMPGRPRKMLGLLPAGLPDDVWPARETSSPRIYLATLMSRDRLQALADAPMLGAHDFWLSDPRHHQVLGEGAMPEPGGEGFVPTADGLVLCLRSQPEGWRGCYRVGYGSFVEANIWLPFTGVLLLLCGLLAGLGYVRWFQRSVIDPAQKAQKEILDSEMFNRTLVETAPVALCVLTRGQGEVLFASPLAQQWLDLSPASAFPALGEGGGPRRQIVDASAPGVIEQLDLDNGRSLHVAYAPTRYRKRDVVLCAFTDITVRAEEQRVLEQAKAAADEASAAKSTFLATMSHEIRTPLYGVLGSLELLALTRLDDQQKQYVERIHGSSQLLLQQISDILDVSRIEAGQMRLEVAPFNPRELLQSCTGSYAGMAQQKNLLLFCTVDPEIPERLLGDAVRLRQIVANLISNAIKFTEAGQVIVRLRGGADEEGGCPLQLQVVDTGIGIARDRLEQLFAPFYVIDAGKHTVRGAGLGLSICERLARLMGGSIAVTSEPGLGSSFTLQLTLPAGEPAPAPAFQLDGLQVLLRSPHPELSQHICRWLARWGAEARPLAAELPPAAEHLWLVDVLMPRADCPSGWQGRYLGLAPREGLPSHPGIDGYSVDSIAEGLGRLALRQVTEEPPPPVRHLALRVLVAEDNPINQATLSNQLEQLGCQVRVVEDGEQALAQWQAATYDLLLTDVNMPRMNGYELTQALRSRGVDGPIVGVTANAMRDEEQRCMQSGMDAWLVKPIDLERLYRLLCRFRPEAPQMASEAPVPNEPPPASPVPERYRAIFHATMGQDLQQFEQAIADQDGPALLQKLHRMRGALAVVGNPALAEALGSLHERLEQHGWDDTLRPELLALHAILRRMVEETA